LHRGPHPIRDRNPTSYAFCGMLVMTLSPRIARARFDVAEIVLGDEERDAEFARHFGRNKAAELSVMGKYDVRRELFRYR